MSKSKFILFIIIAIFFVSGSRPTSASVRCGDIDGNDEINLLDITFLIKYMYKNGETPQDMAACDVDLTGKINILDISYLIRYLYSEGPQPCKGQSIPEGQKYIFEIEYINWAWGYRLEGRVIDYKGDIYDYSYGHNDTPWDTAQSGILTESDLDAKFDHNQVFVGTIPRDTLLKYFYLVEAAGEGPYSPVVNACFDFGTLTVRAYQYESATGAYNSVMMYMIGDFARKNLSPAAEIIFDWMYEDIFGESIDNIVCGYPE
ncbi:MAG TPA: hypothetical protein ENH25_03290 [candidate division Zixibacteria bacterium]|nr:hypothetical protein [candidate division Zixibacteria bacterium]